jgi:uroporphyrin-3 C-methyltransferase
VNSELSDIGDEINPSPPPAQEKPRKSGSGLAIVALLFSLGALALAAWIWWQDSTSRGETERRALSEIARLEAADSELALKMNQVRDTVQAAMAADDGEAFEALDRRMGEDRARMAQLESNIQEQLALSRTLQSATEAMQSRLLAAEAALNGMSSRELDAGGELDLNEVDYLLRLANERLKLFADPVAADQALEVADMHLAAMDNPIYLGVRRDIASARRELASVQLPDSLDLASQLDALQASVADLKFPGNDPVLPSAVVPTDEGWWARLKATFSGLVTVRRSSAEEDQRISLEDKDLIRQRVWLQVEIAHLAMMRRDQSAYSHALQRVEETVRTWFDQDAAGTQAMLDRLTELARADIEVDVPDITAPWATLRAVRAGQARPPAPLPVEEGGE